MFIASFQIGLLFAGLGLVRDRWHGKPDIVQVTVTELGVQEGRQTIFQEIICTLLGFLRRVDIDKVCMLGMTWRWDLPGVRVLGEDSLTSETVGARYR